MQPDSQATRRSAGLGRERRLRSDREIREGYRQGRRRVGRLMVMWLRSGENASLRLAVVSSRKVGNAVARNRARRRLREAFRRNRHRLAGELDIVLVARRPIVESTADEVETELLDLAREAGLLKEDKK